MLRLLSVVLVILFSTASYAAKVDVKGIPENYPFKGQSKCLAPFLCLKKGRTDLAEYNDAVWGNPKFHSGSITFVNGEVVKGKIAVFSDTHDWKFVKRLVLLIPEGEEVAYVVSPGDAFLIQQQTKKKQLAFDAYGDSYLERLVSGKWRLSFNPAAGTSRKLTEFISPVVLEDMQKQLAGHSVKAALKSGKGIRESIAAGESTLQLASIANMVEIVDKEYLLYDESQQSTTAITKDNYRGIMQKLFAACSGADAKKAKKFSKKYKKIQDAVTYLNETCS